MSEDDGRNVHFFDGSTGDMLGGLFQNGSVTQANFIHMLSVVLLGPCTVEMAGQTISQTSQPLTPGDYKVYAPEGGKCYDLHSSMEAKPPANLIRFH